jgi:putative transposase
VPLVRERTTCSTREICRVLQIPRAKQYRPRVESDNSQLVAQIEEVINELPGYGYRRVTKELHRRNQHVNHKKVLSIMRQEALLCKRGKKRKVQTTNSNHNNQIYPNLIKKLIPERPDQVWQADLTYIRLHKGFVYLAAIIDGFSRKVVGHELGLFLDAELPLRALQRAIETRKPKAGLIHHSDRGVQYTSNLYINQLEVIEAQVSMSRKGNPYDNAKMESFMATLKLEEVELSEYSDFFDVEARVQTFIEAVYNKKRLHSSLGYLPPDEFEANFYANQSREVMIQ